MRLLSFMRLVIRTDTVKNFTADETLEAFPVLLPSLLAAFAKKGEAL